MKRITLTKGKAAIVDDADFAALSKHRWYAHKGHRTWYAARKGKTDADGKRPFILMHRVVAKTPPHLETDHRNGNGLDNRRRNLLPCSTSKNLENRSAAQSNSKSGVLGVSWNDHASKWQVQFKRDGKRVHVGLFASKKAAIAARRQALAPTV